MKFHVSCSLNFTAIWFIKGIFKTCLKLYCIFSVLPWLWDGLMPRNSWKFGFIMFLSYVSSWTHTLTLVWLSHTFCISDNNHLNTDHLKGVKYYHNIKFEINFVLISCFFFINYMCWSSLTLYFCSEIIETLNSDEH